MSYKDEYVNNIETQFCKLENMIIADIVRRIKKTGEITSTADWQINKLAELGYSSAKIESIIMQALNATYPDMFELYDNASEWEYVRNKKLYEQINDEFVPYKENEQLQRFVESAKEQTSQTMLNLTSTLGVVSQINGQMTFLPLTQYYQKTLDGAVMDIMSGAFDYNSTIKRAVAELSRSGIRTIDYESGYSSRLPVAVRRAVMTGVSQMTGHIAEMNAKELGTEYFEVDWHAGARPSHQRWQGKVYSKEELTAVCGLGTVTGLKGANCYHDYYPFIPGVSERNWSDEWLKEQNRIENTPIEWNGKKYTAYEARQKQRRMETAMRAQRQKVAGLRQGRADSMDVTVAQARYQGQLQEYKAFSKHMNLKPHMERVYIDGLGRVVPSKTIDIAKSSRNVIIKKRDYEVPKSLGAAGKRYNVRLPEGDHGTLKKGSKVTKIKAFAGKGTDKEIKERYKLEAEYGYSAEKWQKVRGEGTVIVNGHERKAEIHWYEADGEKVKMKVKRYYDES